MKKLLITLLAVAMVIAMVPGMAFAVEGTGDSAVAEVNGTSYTDIQKAIVAAAPNGDTVTLLTDVTVEEWIMFAETLSVANGNIITLNINGLTIDGNDHTLTINSIESADNGNRLFYDATNLNINDLTIKYASGVAGGIGLTSGTIKNVTFDGGVYGVLPGTGNVTITGCTFATKGTAIYHEDARDNLVVTGNTFNQPDDVNVILLRGNTTFTNNTINSGRTVNVVSGSPVVAGNNFNDVRFKVYNEAEATISSNTINELVFNDNTSFGSTFTGNTLSEDAVEALEKVNAEYVAEVNGTKYSDLQEAIKDAAPNGDTVTLLNNVTVEKWIMFSETLSISNGNIITLEINGLTIDGDGHTLTINSIESAGNGNRLFYNATNLNINDLTIKYASGVAGGIGLTSGNIENVNFNGGVTAIYPGTGNVTITGCTFATNGTAIYYEEERDNLVVTGNTFNQPDGANVILLCGNTTFTNNTINSGRTVNVVSGSPAVTGNDFNNVRLKVYTDATATINNNEISNLAFEDGATSVNSTFAGNTLSEAAANALATVKPEVETPAYYPTIEKPVIESADNATVTLGILGTTATITANDGYEIVDVTVNGVSKGAVTSLSGLKTGDKIVVTTKAIEPEKTAIEIAQEKMDAMEMVARSKRTTSPSGKNSIMVYWYDKAGADMEFDGVEIQRSTKKSTGFKKVFTSKTDKYYNTAIEEGVKYYYKVRGFVEVDGEKVYTDWSLKAIRTAK